MSRIFHKQHWANAISIFRLIFLPLFIITSILDLPKVFAGLFVVQLFLDGVDGFIARRLHIESDFGRRLDTIIDVIVWLPGLAIFLLFIRDDLGAIFSAYPHLFIVPLITIGLMSLTAYRYLHTFPAIHLYTGKLTAGLLLLLMLTTLLDRFYPVLGYVTAATAILYHLEATVIYLIRKDQTDENVTSILHLFR